jgi:hypothetical protein
VIRLVLGLTVIGARAASAVWAWPGLESRYLAPVENNKHQFAALSSRIDDLESAIATQSSRTDAVIASSQAGEIDGQAIDRSIEGFEADLAAFEARIEGFEETAFALANADEVASAERTRELTKLRAVQLLSRGRLSLFQSNYGSASADIALATELLRTMENPSPDVASAIERLGTAITALPEAPVAAAADLDVAWDLLLGGLDAPTSPSPPTSSPAAAPTSSTASTIVEASTTTS